MSVFGLTASGCDGIGRPIDPKHQLAGLAEQPRIADRGFDSSFASVFNGGQLLRRDEGTGGTGGSQAGIYESGYPGQIPSSFYEYNSSFDGSSKVYGDHGGDERQIIVGYRSTDKAWGLVKLFRSHTREPKKPTPAEKKSDDLITEMERRSEELNNFAKNIIRVAEDLNSQSRRSSNG